MVVHVPEDRDNLKLNVDTAMLESFDGHVPRHVAIIMDGNGRWAQSRGMKRIRGHHEGANAVRRAVESCRFMGVDVLTLYAFSSQNWGRPEDEVSGLMTLFDLYIRKERRTLLENNVRIKVIGDRSRLSEKLQASIAKLEEMTAPNSVMTLQVAVSYGGREEILRATKTIAQAVERGTLKPDDITEDLFNSCLYTAGLPDPDLIIRTSGEIRVSNFLLWQLAYSEIFVTPVLWPDFDERELLGAFETFSKRERRFGQTSAQVKS